MRKLQSYGKDQENINAKASEPARKLPLLGAAAPCRCDCLGVGRPGSGRVHTNPGRPPNASTSRDSQKTNRTHHYRAEAACLIAVASSPRPAPARISTSD